MLSFSVLNHTGYKRGQEILFTYNRSVRDPMVLLHAYGFAVDNSPTAFVMLLTPGGLRGIEEKSLYQEGLDSEYRSRDPDDLKLLLTKMGINEFYLRYLRLT